MVQHLSAQEIIQYISDAKINTIKSIRKWTIQ